MGNGASAGKKSAQADDEPFELHYLPLSVRFGLSRKVVSLAHKRLSHLQEATGMPPDPTGKSLSLLSEHLPRTDFGRDSVALSALKYSFLGAEPALTLGIMLEAASMFLTSDLDTKLGCFIDILTKCGEVCSKRVFVVQCSSTGCMTEKEAGQLFDVISDMKPYCEQDGCISQEQLKAFFQANCSKSELEEVVDIDFEFLCGDPEAEPE